MISWFFANNKQFTEREKENTEGGFLSKHKEIMKINILRNLEKYIVFLRVFRQFFIKKIVELRKVVNKGVKVEFFKLMITWKSSKSGVALFIYPVLF